MEESIDIVNEDNNVDAVDVEEQSQIDERTQEKYKYWKKNVPYLYDYMSTNSLLWPSLTVQFFPELETPLPKEVGPNDDFKSPNNDSDLTFQRLLHGTFTLGQSIDSISILQFPYYTNLKKYINIDKLNYNYDKEEFELNTVSKKKVTLMQKINHLGDVNKVRYMPQNPDIIASANNIGDLVLYDRTKHSSIKNNIMGNDVNTNKPQFRLVNKMDKSASEIFAIDWNKQKEGVLLSGNMNGTINVFDLKILITSKDIDVLNSMKSMENKTIGVNDIEWLSLHDSIFALVDDNGNIKVFDTRLESPVIAEHKKNVSINSISLNPGNSFCLGTGDSEGGIDIWDIRNFGSDNVQSVSSFKAHDDAITQIKWHSKYHNIIGSSSSDKLVKLFDMANTDSDKLIFLHGGHMLGVNDFDWSLHDDWLTASVADDNSLHIWKPAHSIIRNYSNN